jgi:hypothetical protein
MKHLKIIIYVILTTMSSLLHAQCPPPSSLGNISITSPQTQYCINSNINGKFNLGSQSYNYKSPVSWSYSGGGALVVSGGAMKINFAVNGLQSSGFIQASTVIDIGGTACPVTLKTLITVDDLQAVAGPPQLYIPNLGPVTIGGNPCYLNGVAPYTTSWSNSLGSACQAQVSGISANTTYVLTIQDAYCTATSQVTVYMGTEQYAVLKKILDGGYHQVSSSSNTLYFKYDGEYNSGNLDYKIYDDLNNLKCNNCVTLTKNYGDNRYALSLSAASVSTPGYYYLEVTNEKNEVFKLKFKK